MYQCIGIGYWIGLHSYTLENHRTPLARYPWIGIGYWIGSYHSDQGQNDGTWTKWSSGFVNGYIHIQWKQSEDNTSKVPMNWNWFWIGSFQIVHRTKWSSGLWMVYLCIGIGYWIGLHSYALIKNHGTPLARYPWIGIGHIRWCAYKMIFGVIKFVPIYGKTKILEVCKYLFNKLLII